MGFLSFITFLGHLIHQGYDAVRTMIVPPIPPFPVFNSPKRFIPSEDMDHETHRFFYKILKEKFRLKTFKNWKFFSQDPRLLAKAGFFYFGEGDQTQCAFCMGVVGNWEAEDNPFKEHKRLFPECPFVSGNYVGNIPMPLQTYILFRETLKVFGLWTLQQFRPLQRYHRRICWAIKKELHRRFAQPHTVNYPKAPE